MQIEQTFGMWGAQQAQNLLGHFALRPVKGREPATVEVSTIGKEAQYKARWRQRGIDGGDQHQRVHGRRLIAK